MSLRHDSELADTVEAEVRKRRGKRRDPLPELVQLAVAAYPESFRRVRSACQWAASYIDLDEHAAAVVLEAERAKAERVLR